MRYAFIPFAAAIAVSARTSTARGDATRVQTGASLGYAFPAGALERGSKVSDVTYGLTELRIDGAYRLSPAWLIGLAVGYGVAIPKLCATSSDCVSSLGHDVTLGALGRWRVGVWKTFEPSVDIELGYEWFKANSTDNGATSSRAYRGWYASLAAFGAFRLSRRFILGPVLATTGGIFQNAAFEAPGVSTSHGTDGALPHLWLRLGVRAVAEW